MVKLTLRERESIQEALRRFRKLVERSGIKKEMRRREYYEKPSEIKRRARLRAERRSRRGSTMGRVGLYRRNRWRVIPLVPKWWVRARRVFVVLLLIFRAYKWSVNRPPLISRPSCGLVRAIRVH